MKRDTFLGRMTSGVIMTASLKTFADRLAAPRPDDSSMPILFVGHGNPMNALLDNDITRGWAAMAAGLRPRAILCISAHWETRGTRVTMAPRPQTIHDFYGFPAELHDVEYPAPGSPELGKDIIEQMNRTVMEDHEWGLDHGAWSVIMKMFPDADVPVLQLSLDRNLSLKAHYELASELSFLRKRGVLIVGSGNLIHNLRHANWNSDAPYEWAIEFDEQLKDLISSGNHDKLIRAEQISHAAALSIPTREHYLPLLYTLALKEEQENIMFFNESILMGSMGMRSIVISP